MAIVKPGSLPSRWHVEAWPRRAKRRCPRACSRRSRPASRCGSRPPDGRGSRRRPRRCAASRTLSLARSSTSTTGRRSMPGMVRERRDRARCPRRGRCAYPRAPARTTATRTRRAHPRSSTRPGAMSEPREARDSSSLSRPRRRGRPAAARCPLPTGFSAAGCASTAGAGAERLGIAARARRAEPLEVIRERDLDVAGRLDAGRPREHALRGMAQRDSGERPARGQHEARGVEAARRRRRGPRRRSRTRAWRRRAPPRIATPSVAQRTVRVAQRASMRRPRPMRTRSSIMSALVQPRERDRRELEQCGAAEALDLRRPDRGEDELAELGRAVEQRKGRRRRRMRARAQRPPGSRCASKPMAREPLHEQLGDASFFGLTPSR